MPSTQKQNTWASQIIMGYWCACKTWTNSIWGEAIYHWIYCAAYAPCGLTVYVRRTWGKNVSIKNRHLELCDFYDQFVLNCRASNNTSVLWKALRGEKVRFCSCKRLPLSLKGGLYRNRTVISLVAKILIVRLISVLCDKTSKYNVENRCTI